MRVSLGPQSGSVPQGELWLLPRDGGKLLGESLGKSCSLEPAGSSLSSLNPHGCDFWPRWVLDFLSVKWSEIFLPSAAVTLRFYSLLHRSA